MIYRSYDYYSKYADTIAYVIGRALTNKYSFSYIEKSIANANFIREFERSNITSIAFQSMEKNYSSIFDDVNNYEYDQYDMFNWIGNAYLYLFLDNQITFEALFILFPIREMINLYPLYHEMDITKLDDLFCQKSKFSLLDGIMNARKISSNKLAALTGISVSTIKALRYNKRDLNKLQFAYVNEISIALNIRIESLFNLKLELD